MRSGDLEPPVRSWLTVYVISFFWLVWKVLNKSTYSPVFVSHGHRVIFFLILSSAHDHMNTFGTTTIVPKRGVWNFHFLSGNANLKSWPLHASSFFLLLERPRSWLPVKKIPPYTPYSQGIILQVNFEHGTHWVLPRCVDVFEGDEIVHV